MKLYDSLIIGGGPAGLSAAIYLARFNRSVLVIDAGHGRTQYREHNENYLGFPEGIQAQKLRELGKEQAERYGAEFFVDKVLAIKKNEKGFEALGQRGKYESRSVIIATGVMDLFPTFEDYVEYVGISLFWCITCDGYKTRDKKVVVVGNTDESVVTCLQFLNYTKDLFFITNCEDGMNKISAEYIERLRKHNIPYMHGCIETVKGKDGQVECIEMADGQRIETDFIFNQQGAAPNTEIAKDLGVTLDKHNYIISNDNQRTNIPFVYAAGDVTKQFAHQVVTAAHEGSMAAQAANYDLYTPEQKE
jgi:thioredoxin reductase (NADPH)